MSAERVVESDDHKPFSGSGDEEGNESQEGLGTTSGSSNGDIEVEGENDDSSAIDNSELIRLASAAAIANAVAMKRSDSDLSHGLDDSVDHDGDDDSVFEKLEKNTIAPVDHDLRRSPSITFMEHSSYEAEMVTHRHHRLHPGGRLDSVRTTSSNQVFDVNLDESRSNDDDNCESSELDFNGSRSFHGANEASQWFFPNISRTALPVVPVTDYDEQDRTNTRQDITYQCTDTFDLSSSSKDFTMSTPGEKEADGVAFLSIMFDGFCRPSVPPETFQRILELEQGSKPGNVDLPIGAVILKPSLPLIEALGGGCLRLPKILALSLFRVLLRLLVGFNDDMYNFCVMTACPWYDELFSKEEDTVMRFQSEGIVDSAAVSVQKLYPGSDESTATDLMYTVSRLRAKWKNSVHSTLNLIECALDDNDHDCLVSPLCLLLGVLCAGGVAVDELRRMLLLASGEKYDSAKLKLMMVRALGIAASSTTKPKVGNGYQLCFFSIFSGDGMCSRISLHDNAWPFRNDFAAKLSFRAEDFEGATCGSIILFSAMGDMGNGVRISLSTLPREETDHGSAGILVISLMDNRSPIQAIRLQNCPLHARVWYHVSIRHTRSRLKGVFSLSAKEQLSVMINGKTMHTESVEFPFIHESLVSKNLFVKYGENFDGQLGKLYVFHDYVNDTILKSVHRNGHETKSDVGRSSTQSEDSARDALLLLKLRQNARVDDLQDIAVFGLSDDATDNLMVVDLIPGGESKNASDDLSKKIYMSWDPHRATGDGFILDVHSGAHIKLIEDECANLWTLQRGQDVIKSLGVRSLIPFLHSLLQPGTSLFDVPTTRNSLKASQEFYAFCAIVPDMLFLTSSFIKHHKDNAREMVRCGFVECLESRILECFESSTTVRRFSVLDALTCFSSLSIMLTQRLLELRCLSSGCVDLEAVVISRLVYNVSLWFHGLPKGGGVCLAKHLFPALSSTMMNSPIRVCRFVGLPRVLRLLQELSAIKVFGDYNNDLLNRDSRSVKSIFTGLNVKERNHVMEVLLVWIFEVFRTGSNLEDLEMFISLVSNNLDSEFEMTASNLTNGTEKVTTLHQPEQDSVVTLKFCIIFLVLLRCCTTFAEDFAAVCGDFRCGLAWILCAMVNSHCDEVRGIGLQCFNQFLRVSRKHGELFNTLKGPNMKPKCASKWDKLAFVSQVGRGIATLAPSSGLAAMTSSMITTQRVSYKLLWHLLKVHRYRIGTCTDAGLIDMAFDSEPISWSLRGESPMEKHMSFEQLSATITRSTELFGLFDKFGISTLLRLLRFLPDDHFDTWVSRLLAITQEDFEARKTLAFSSDWQPCVFSWLSDTFEKGENLAKNSPSKVNGIALGKRLDSCFGLYALLLGSMVRVGGEKAIVALEECGALQRVFANGPDVFGLLLSHLLANLYSFGVSSDIKNEDSRQDGKSRLETIQESARHITDAILTKGDTAALATWKVLRYLGALVTYIVASSVADGTISGFWRDDVNPFYPENGIKAFYAEEVFKLSKNLNAQSILQRRRNVSLRIAEQILMVLDVFIFPEMENSHLHGIALVRGTETRTGNAQGPLIASLIYMSLVLWGNLDPSSVQMLECSKRLLCFTHYCLEMIQEYNAMEGYTSSFESSILDRRLQSILVQSQSTLQKCRKVIEQIETASQLSPVVDKENRKKSHRRVFKVCLEVRKIMVLVYERRRSLWRSVLTEEACLAFRSSIESLNENLGNDDSQFKGSSEKEKVVRTLLSSKWVLELQSPYTKQKMSGQIYNSLLTDDCAFIEASSRDTASIIDDFQSSLDPSFEDYLEKHRVWAESSAVRDLEFQGDALLKVFARNWGLRVTNIDLPHLVPRTHLDAAIKTTGACWRRVKHWMIPWWTDPMGRRIVLVPNADFNEHKLASYDLTLGSNDNEKTKHYVDNDLIRRNSSAFVPGSFSDVDIDNTIEENNEEMYEKIDASEKNGASIVVVSGRVWTKTSVDEELPTEESVDDPSETWARSFLWAETESIVAQFDDITFVSLQSVCHGRILLSTHNVYFRQSGERIDVITREPISATEVSLSLRWCLRKLTEIFGRTYMLKTVALELFFVDCKEVFLSFSTQKERNRFYAKLRNSCIVPLLKPPESLNPRVLYKRSNITALWKKRKISNFDYIVALNRMAGRTYNDISQYPVFPWILSDYESSKIDLTDSKVYRDLSKPIGALNPERLALLCERFNELESFGFAEKEKFLYGSHYSSPGIVLHYLVRQEPFTSFAVALQSGRFDCPDRLFFDISETWRGVNTSTSDVKELIPEFFTMPEIFCNQNKFPLGRTQKGIAVDDVILPPWAKGSAHEFVRIHRLALESDYVSSNLHGWIDLIFGYKQRGEQAQINHNLFHPLSYEGNIDLGKITDDLDRQAAEGHILNFGQTPSKLLSAPHAERCSSDVSWYPLIDNMSYAVRLRCYTPAQSHQFGKQRGLMASSVLSIYVDTDKVIAVYSDLKVGFFAWSPKRGSGKLRPMTLKTLECRELSRSVSMISLASSLASNANGPEIGNWNFAFSLGGGEMSKKKRRALDSSRLASAKDALYFDVGPILVSCGYFDDSIKVHTTEGCKLVSSERKGHVGKITCLAAGIDGGFLVTGSEDCTCLVWMVAYPEMAAVLADSYVRTLFGHDTDSDSVLSCCHVLFGHETPVSCVALSYELDVVASCSNNTVCIHTLRTGIFVRSFETSDSPTISIRKMALEKHGRMVLQLSDFSISTFTVNGSFIASADAGERLNDMLISGEMVVTGGDDGHCNIRNLSSLKVLSGLNLSRHGPIRSLWLTPDNLNPFPQNLFIGSDDGMISVVEKAE